MWGIATRLENELKTSLNLATYDNGGEWIKRNHRKEKETQQHWKVLSPIQIVIHEDIIDSLIPTQFCWYGIVGHMMFQWNCA